MSRLEEALFAGAVVALRRRANWQTKIAKAETATSESGVVIERAKASWRFGWRGSSTAWPTSSSGKGTAMSDRARSISAVCLRRLARRIHELGPRPLFELLRELVDGAEPLPRITRYSELDPGVLAYLGGDRIREGAER